MIRNKEMMRKGNDGDDASYLGRQNRFMYTKLDYFRADKFNINTSNLLYGKRYII
jgi:hypothetical protein